jgi:hypothetical protein
MAAACTTTTTQNGPINRLQGNDRRTTASSGPEAGQNAAAPPEANTSTGSTVSAQECYEVETGDDVVMRSQTFPIDFEPFSGSCFVTTYNPEYDDPPMESQYGIYKDGRRVLELPDQFNGATFGCWVAAVSFQDLNADNLKDVIVVGKCSAKSRPYNENMVYINTGKTFVTRPDGNNRLGQFTKAKEIADFVQDNQQIFYK